MDEQQVNLTRFSLQLPEKREFFLEGRGIFSFASFPTTGSGGGNSGGASTSTTPLLFYSRRIGLNAGRVIPIDVGGRVTGKVGKFSLGMLNIETADEAASKTPQTNFTVMRLKRDVLRRSAIGVMMTNRSQSASVAGASNQGYGVDGVFNFFSDLTMGGYYAATQTTGVHGRRGQLSGARRLRPGPLRRADRAREVGRRLQPGGRLPSQAQLRAHLRRTALQSAARARRASARSR